MMHLKDLRARVKLCNGSKSSSVLSNVTCCSSVKEMNHRYIQLVSVLSDILVAKTQPMPEKSYTIQELMGMLEYHTALDKVFRYESV